MKSSAKVKNVKLSENEELGWCMRIDEAVLIRDGRCLKKNKPPICGGCRYNHSENVSRETSY